MKKKNRNTILLGVGVLVLALIEFKIVSISTAQQVLESLTRLLADSTLMFADQITHLVNGIINSLPF